MIFKLHKSTAQRSVKQACLADPRAITRLAKCTVLMLGLVLCTGYTAQAFADGKQRSRAEAVEIAKSRSGDGRVLSVNKKVNKSGVSVFAVKIISNGRVKVYTVREFKN